MRPTVSSQPEPMKKGTSLYLDLVRFSAALMVFLVHLKVHAKGTFGPFWGFHLDYSSQTAVTVFFVLSGYVIAHVLATREGTPLEYCASRFARLYSVVVPALILTALLCGEHVVRSAAALIVIFHLGNR